MGVRFPHGRPNKMTLEEMKKIYEEMLVEFGEKLPNADHCPKEFQYYVKLHMYDRKFKHENNSK